MAKNELVTPLGDSAMDETNNALKITLATSIAGERLQDSATPVIANALRASGVMAIILSRVFHTLGSSLGVSIREDYSIHEYYEPADYIF